VSLQSLLLPSLLDVLVAPTRLSCVFWEGTACISFIRLPVGEEPNSSNTEVHRSTSWDLFFLFFVQAAQGGSKIQWKGLYAGLAGNIVGVLPWVFSITVKTEEFSYASLEDAIMLLSMQAEGIWMYHLCFSVLPYCVFLAISPWCFLL